MASEAADLSYVTVAKGTQSGIRERQFAVIRTQQDWEALWRIHRSMASPEGPIPRLDVAQDLVLAVFAGEKSTGGYAIEIVEVEEDRVGGVLKVFVRETSPPPGAMLIQVLTQPHHIVKLKRIDLPAVFVPVAP